MDHAYVRRRSVLLGLALGLAGCAPRGLGGAVSGATPSGRLRLLGEARLPHRLGFKGTILGGISGVDYDPAAGLWYLLSDDRSEVSPARFYTARIPVSESGLGPLDLLDVVTLRQADGTPYPSRRTATPADPEVPDPESIRWRPETGTLLWSSEGDAKLGLPPFVREIRPDGSHIREFSLPAMFQMAGKGSAADTGPRDNLSFEGLGLTPDGKQLWVSMEAPLYQDGPLPSPSSPGGPCRFTCFDVASGRALRQIAYPLDPIPRPPLPAGAYADNGVSEILMINNTGMLVLERAYMAGYPPGQGNSLRIYRVNPAQGPDVLGTAVLRPGNYRAVAKQLVANLDDFTAFAGQPGTGPALERLDNTECLAWGPRLGDRATGPRTLLLASDDNFNPQQINQFLAFAWT